MRLADVNQEDAVHGVLLSCRSLTRRAGIAHGFTTRRGGVSEGPLSSLNLAQRDVEPAERLIENWTRVAAALDPTLDAPRVAVLNQVHGNRVVRVSEPQGPLRTVADADASFTTETGLVLAVRVADCVPVLLAGPGVVGVAHAGWRGVATDVVGALSRAIEATTNTPASALSAAIGPCISGAQFEVGPEVIEGLAASGLAVEAFVCGQSARGRPLVDLVAAVRAQLSRAGVAEVDALGRCTVSDPDFYSHRRDGPTTGRSAGVVVRLA